VTTDDHGQPAETAGASPVADALLADFEQRLSKILDEHPDGIDEFKLIKLLQREGHEAFAPDLFEDHLSLFRAHFILFHALYRLRDRLHAEGKGTLEIHTLRVVLLPYADVGEALAAEDRMRAYYIDLTNLAETTAEDVEEMLGTFWARYYARERRAEALSWLGLEDPVDEKTIRERYRELALVHHPDRGGDKARFQQLSEAMAILKRAS